MGHVVDFIVLDTRDEIWFEASEFAFYNVDREEDPTLSYHGNLTIHDNFICEDIHAAKEKINELDTGFYSDHAVQFYDYSHIGDAQPTKKLLNLKSRLAEMEQKYEEYVDKTHVCRRTSQFIGCEKCGSKINSLWFSYESGKFRTDKCAVCNFDLRSPTTKARIEKYHKDMKELRKLISKDEAKLQDRVNARHKPKVKWLLKVEVHC